MFHQPNEILTHSLLSAIQILSDYVAPQEPRGWRGWLANDQRGCWLESLRRKTVREKSTINMLQREGVSVELMGESQHAHLTLWE